MNGFLLQHDLTVENLTVHPGGWGDLNYSRMQKAGLGFSIGEGTLESESSVCAEAGFSVPAASQIHGAMMAGEPN
jgi:hypothetical protein